MVNTPDGTYKVKVFRLLSVLLCACLILTSVPSIALAEEIVPSENPTQEKAQEESAPNAHAPVPDEVAADASDEAASGDQVQNELELNVQNAEATSVKTREKSADVVESWDISAGEDRSVTATFYTTGLLKISGSGAVKNLGWTDWDNVDQGYWGPYRSQVTALALDSTVFPTSMAYWFFGFTSLASLPPYFSMPQSVKDARWAFAYCSDLSSLSPAFQLPSALEVATGMFAGSGITTLPSSLTLRTTPFVTDVSLMFSVCPSLVSLPDSFGIADSVTNMYGMFYKCTALTAVPRGFTIPEGVTSTSALFSETAIREIPSRLVIPEGVTNTQEMFAYSRALMSIPVEFDLPQTVTNASGMFKECRSLSSVPEGFTVPDQVANANEMFAGCSLLASVPQSLSVPQQADITDMFALSEGSLSTTYLGSDPRLSKPETWEPWGRVLATDAYKATFMMNDGTESVYATTYTDSSKKVAQPQNPVRSDYVFDGWYVKTFEGDVDWDFTQPLTSDTVLYARWIFMAWDVSLYGDGSVKASLNSEGVLSIEGSGPVKDFGWDVGDSSEGYWGPYRDMITAVSLDENIRPTSMARWFAFCSNLESLSSGFTVPEGVTNVSYLFQESGSLESLPESFVLSESVVNAIGMFEGASSLTHLPSQFTLPEGLAGAVMMFMRCENLKTLPPNFTLPSGVLNATWMFVNCSSLQALPVGFTVPEGVQNALQMFAGCSALEFLPEGFMLPNSLRDAGDMFSSCPRLVSIPKSFSVPAHIDIQGLFGLPKGATPTTYLGSDPRLSNPETWKPWNRTLVTDTQPEVPADNPSTQPTKLVATSDAAVPVVAGVSALAMLACGVIMLSAARRYKVK